MKSESLIKGGSLPLATKPAAFPLPPLRGYAPRNAPAAMFYMLYMQRQALA
jgi:hypothetical protein